ncbi:MAG: hypothetical protein A2Y59_06030 [Chloroflexi bacterium RBG_13_52_14]|nr:MAG: hypothetical protein A2Y59_06030 [Chloroflexi bacterium RBG_13_52_14]
MGKLLGCLRNFGWGATKAETKRAMPGDDEAKRPMSVSTNAVSIRARAVDIWPWLVQMGYSRGGMYSYDRIDRLLGILDRPSANRIIPEFQHLEVGDVIPMGKPPSWPVKAIEPNRLMLIVIKEPGVEVTWCFMLDEIDDKQTRLVLRVRSSLAMTPMLLLSLPIMYPGQYLMIRKMLLGIKQRAEANKR